MSESGAPPTLSPDGLGEGEGRCEQKPRRLGGRQLGPTQAQAQCALPRGTGWAVQPRGAGRVGPGDSHGRCLSLGEAAPATPWLTWQTLTEVWKLEQGAFSPAAGPSPRTRL